MKKAVATIIFLLAAVMCAYSEELSVGVGYPYFSVKYAPVELRYAIGDGINVLAGRFYLNFWDNNVTRGYTGVEGGYLKFDTLEMKGTGYEGSIFIGGECFVTESLSLSADIASTYISLKSEDNYKASGMEIVANISVNYYFSRNITDDSEDEDGDAENPVETNNEALIKDYLDRASQFTDEGAYKRAISEYKKVLNLDPENETAKEEIERIKVLFTIEE